MTGLALLAVLAFGSDPGLIFSDGFEAGSTCAWTPQGCPLAQRFGDRAMEGTWSASRTLSGWDCWPAVYCTLTDEHGSRLAGAGKVDFELPSGTTRVTLDATLTVTLSTYPDGSFPGVATWRRVNAWRETFTMPIPGGLISGTLFAYAEPLESSTSLGLCMERWTWERCAALGDYPGARAEAEQLAAELAWSVNATITWSRPAIPGVPVQLPPGATILRITSPTVVDIDSIAFE